MALMSFSSMRLWRVAVGCRRAATRASPPPGAARAAGGLQRAGPPRARRRRTGRGSRPRPRGRRAARRAGCSSSSSGIERAPSMCPAANSSLGADVDEHDVAASQPRDQLVAPDRLDVLAEVLARGSLDLGQPGDRGVAQRQPQRKRLVAGERVAHAGALARARDHARGVQRLQVLGGVRRRLPARPRELLDACAAPAPAGRAARGAAGWRTPCPSARSPQTARPSRHGPHHIDYSRDHLIACQVGISRRRARDYAPSTCRSFTTSAPSTSPVTPALDDLPQRHGAVAGATRTTSAITYSNPRGRAPTSCSPTRPAPAPTRRDTAQAEAHVRLDPHRARRDPRRVMKPIGHTDPKCAALALTPRCS